MNVPGFTSEAVDFVNAMLFAQGQENPYEGQCKQKQKRAADKGPRTPAQAAADQRRRQANTGQNNIDPATRSQAARKGAQTRSTCSG